MGKAIQIVPAMFPLGLALLPVDDAKLLQWTHGIEICCFCLSNAEQLGDTKSSKVNVQWLRNQNKLYSWLKDAQGY